MSIAIGWRQPVLCYKCCMEPASSTAGAFARIGAIAAPIGAVVLIVSTLLHPLEADPDDAPAAFAEYAADPLWVWSHLGQFAGFAVLGIALIGLAATLEAGRAVAWTRIGLVGIAATIAVAAVLQAVDGVALKVMVDRWAAAGAELGDARFEAAFAVRQVEIGLAALFNVLFGSTLAALSIAILSSSRYPQWLGAGGLVVALAIVAAGAATAFAGFSAVPMTIVMLATLMFLVWLVAAAILMWRLAPQLSRTAETGEANTR
jgi:hypothetical protein